MRIVAAVVLPFLINSIYLYFSRWPTEWFTGTTDILFLALSLGSGAALIATLPFRGGMKALLLTIYVPIAGILLFYFTFLFIALAFGDGL